MLKEHAMATKHPLDGSEPPVNIGGRPPALKPEHIAVLHEIVKERAQASLQEIADELYHRCGVRVCDATIRRTFACARHRTAQAETQSVHNGVQSAQALWLHGSASARRRSFLQYQSD
jgi:transposase